MDYTCQVCVRVCVLTPGAFTEMGSGGADLRRGVTGPSAGDPSAEGGVQRL